MPTVSPSGGLAGSAPAVTPAKSIKQRALEAALVKVREVAANPGGAVVLQQIREHQAAAAQERLDRALERYQLLRKSLSQVLVFGDGRFAARIAKDAAALARQIAGAAKDMA
jgi:capsule polysaccharide modification protein KpsS